MAILTVEFMVTLDLHIPDELAARMTLDDICDTADLAGHMGGPVPLVMGNEVVGVCSCVVIPLREGLTPDDVIVYGDLEGKFPNVEGAHLSPA